MIQSEKRKVLIQILIALILIIFFIIYHLLYPIEQTPIRFEFNNIKYVSNSNNIESFSNNKSTKTIKNNNIEYDNELKCLALNMYHEARNQGKIGMLLVGHVTINRVLHNNYPKTICEVVYQNKQFSWVHTVKDHNPKERESWKLAMKLAQLVINRDFDRSNGALFFHHETIYPYWLIDINIQKSSQYKNHIFYTFNG